MYHFNLEWDEVEKLPVTIYRTLMNQSLNIAALYCGGKFEYLSEDDQLEKALSDIARLKREGRWKK